MEYVRFGKTGLKVSPACLGTMTFGKQTDEDGAREIVKECLDAGVNFLDTANVYNGGASEEIIGRLTKGVRNDLIISTKVRGQMGSKPNESGLSRRHVLASVEASLRRLQTDYIDIYFMHAPDYDVSLEESFSATDALVKSGKVRYVAVSNFASWQLMKAHWIADRHGYEPPALAQPMYNLLSRQVEQEFFPACLELGVGTMVYNPLAGGMLTGKYVERKLQENTRFDLYDFYRDRYWHDETFNAVESLQSIAKQEGVSLLEFSLRWCFQHPAVHVAILGASRVEQIRESLEVFEKSRDEMWLSADALSACDAVWARAKAVAPQYNR
ncbi:MAG: aldo/keto reductase [Candidatus Poribacteria bacterium]|nr:aldo/keto reductase [Candidatus Poribacteria bacterium]